MIRHYVTSQVDGGINGETVKFVAEAGVGGDPDPVFA